MQDTVSVVINGKHEEIFMSYGLLNHLSLVVGDAERVSAIGIDAELRDQVLKCLLSERTKTGKIKNERSAEDVEISLEDVETLLDWSSEHLIDFFLRRALKAKSIIDKRSEQIQALMGS